jgi:hypothetical protein
MKLYLSRVLSLWRRRILTVVISILLFLSRFTSRRSRVHWIGRHDRPRRPERAVFVSFFAIAMSLLEPREYVVWSITWGSATSVFLILVTLYRLLPRKRAHWIQ